jgi:hypothetical protein
MVKPLRWTLAGEPARDRGAPAMVAELRAVATGALPDAVGCEQRGDLVAVAAAVASGDVGSHQGADGPFGFQLAEPALEVCGHVVGLA